MCKGVKTRRSNRQPVPKRKECEEGKEVNIKTNRCRKKCKPGYYRNKQSQRCRKIK